jgi:hypothetical protein
MLQAEKLWSKGALEIKIKQVRCELRPKLISLPRGPCGHQPLLSLWETPDCNNRANRTLVLNYKINRWLTCLHSVGNAVCGPHVVQAELCVYLAIFLENQGHIFHLAVSFLRFRDHTQGHTTVGRTPLDEWSARRRDLYLTTHNAHNRQTSMLPAGFEAAIPAGERLQTHVLDRSATGIGHSNDINQNFC